MLKKLFYCGIVILILTGCDNTKPNNIIQSNNLILAEMQLPEFNPNKPLKQLVLYESETPVVSREDTHETNQTIVIYYDSTGAITDTNFSLNLDGESLAHHTIEKADNSWRHTEYVLDDTSNSLVPGYIFTYLTDSAGRINEIQVNEVIKPNHLDIPISAEFSYDNDNRIISSFHQANTQTKTTRYSYLNNGLLHKIEQHIVLTIADLEIIMTTEYAYNDNKEMIQRTRTQYLTNSEQDIEEAMPEVQQCIEFDQDSHCIKFIPKPMREGVLFTQQFIY
ncbi:hypothetical protein [Zophobihabitans entericus]|uniref:Uncharacterized protein n=1 Tax=Zophobihabitans entericus TaxID=1635327 RepID=A0A6G9IBF9_9GAMM|nr:hypothetical protein [Zophobihabitans entericus]QIQ21167.1 hypothetical protein IPMB12_05425 [Zophobihabitans entericus]